MWSWQLAYCENRSCVHSQVRSRTDVERLGFPVIPAVVPGNFELDFMRAGLLPDLFYSDNALLAQRLENLHLWYMTEFEVEEPASVLHFEGVDTVAEIYVNGVFAGSHDNMFTSFDVAPAFRPGKNELVVHILPVCLAARAHEIPPAYTAMRYNFPSLVFRKAGHTFGWDIMPRIVSGGIWKPVTLTVPKKDRIRHVYAALTAVGEDRASLHLHISVEAEGDFITDYTVKVRGQCRDSVFSCEDTLWHTDALLPISVEDPHLWWPKNSGAPELYDTVVELYREGRLCDTLRLHIGLRKIELICEDMAPDGEGGEFCFVVNGKKTFVLGTNWVPLDAFHSRDGQRLSRALALLDDVGCNMVRCWGGNVYESDDFYDFCDRKGIMVWQDFAMGCACYPNDARMAKQLEAEAVAQILRLRNHACLALWAGDNECDAAAMGWNGIRLDPGKNRLTREILPRAVMAWDYTHCYLPSSPYVSERAYREGLPLPEDHLWGPRDYFKGDYYRNAVCHFASETGYHGFPAVASLRTFLREPERIFEENGSPTREYLVHAACMEPREGARYAFRIRLAYDQVITLFGKAEAALADFVQQSQISQAEAKKYFIERFRIGKWRRTGIIWWNLLDGWPQVSDAVVDYYFRKKLAYAYIRRSQAPVCLMFDEWKDGGYDLYAANDLPRPAALSYEVTDAETGETLLRGAASIPADSTVKLDTLTPGETAQRFLLLRWTADGAEGRNHYVTNIRGIDYRRYVSALKKCGFLASDA